MALEGPATDAGLAADSREPLFERPIFAEPIRRPAELSLATSEEMGSPAPERVIESVLAEVRAGIEQLLAQPAPAEQVEQLAETIRRALADQGDALLKAGAELRGGVDALAGSLQATLGSVEATERRHIELMAELLRLMEEMRAPTAPAAGSESVAPPDARSNAEIADALRNLLREFDEA